jgi:predicted ATPase
MAIDTLAAAGLVTRARSVEQIECAFRHALLQEAIYNISTRRSRVQIHSRLLDVVLANRSIAPWIGDAVLAGHAQRGERYSEAIELLISAGIDSSSRFSMTEARGLLESGLDLLSNLHEHAQREAWTLSIYKALGPVLIALEGSASSQARNLYDEGVQLARRRPASEMSEWFPLYWGWWFTGPKSQGYPRRA